MLDLGPRIFDFLGKFLDTGWGRFPSLLGLYVPWSYLNGYHRFLESIKGGFVLLIFLSPKIELVYPTRAKGLLNTNWTLVSR